MTTGHSRRGGLHLLVASINRLVITIGRLSFGLSTMSIVGYGIALIGANAIENPQDVDLGKFLKNLGVFCNKEPQGIVRTELL